MRAAPAAPAAFAARLAAARFRAWHRGTREADLVLGGFYDRFHAEWDEAQLAWFEAVLDADEAEVLGWAMGAPAPAAFEGPQLAALRRLDYVTAR